MMPAAKHGDPQLGVDIHLCVVPPSPSPVPLPTPHTSIVFDPMDYVPVIGATVTVCGMKRAVAGTAGIAIHIPPGFPFAPKLPDKDDEIFMGSATVVADGDPFSFLGVPVLACQVAGMPSPPRPKRKGGPRAMLLPTVFNLAIPTNVFVGGPPIISLMGMAFKFGLALLGRLAKTRFAKALGQRFQAWRKAKFGHLNPGFLKCKILRAEPVNIVTGAVSVEQADFTLPGLIPVAWNRRYISDNRRRGAAGMGWETPADARLEFEPETGIVLFHHPEAPLAIFPSAPAAPGDAGAVMELMDGAMLSDQGEAFAVRTKEDRIYRFPKALATIATDGVREVPLGLIEDLCGNTLFYERDAQRRLVAIREWSGRRIEIDWSPAGFISRVSLHVPETGFRHVYVAYEQDRAGDLVAVRDALGNPYRFAYDAHHMVRHTDRNGLSFHYEFDRTPESWRVTRSWGDGGLYAYRFEYVDAAMQRRITDSLGHVSVVTLDERGLPVSEIDPLGGKTVFEYDEAGRTTAVVDQDGHRTEYVFDERGNLTLHVRPDGAAIVRQYDENGKVLSISDPSGQEWKQRWNSGGKLIEIISPLGFVSRYEYDSRGCLRLHTNARGASTAFSYDSYGRIANFLGPEGTGSRFVHDALGNLKWKIDAAGRQTMCRFDAKCRLTEVLLPGGATFRRSYDAQDNPVSDTDENGNEHRYRHVGLGEIAERMLPNGRSVHYRYDSEERIIGVTNERGETFSLIRDPMGRIVEEVDPWGHSCVYQYSIAGRLISAIDAVGGHTEYETDPLGRVVRARSETMDGSGSRWTETFSFDPNGNLVEAQNPTASISRRFDADRRLLEEVQILAGGETFAVRHVYDQVGNRTSRVIEGLSTEPETIEFDYDLADRTVAIRKNGEPVLRSAYGPTGKIIEERFGDRIHRTLSYTDRDRVERSELLLDGKKIANTEFLYDPVGNLTRRTDSDLGTDEYGYDPVGRVLVHTNPEFALRETFHKQAMSDARGAVVGRSQVPRAERAWRRALHVDGALHAYDAMGLLRQRAGPVSTIDLTWDGHRRLRSCRVSGHDSIEPMDVAFAYDALGRRVVAEIDGARTFFVWDGNVLAADVTPSGSREFLYRRKSAEPVLCIERAQQQANGRCLYFVTDDNGCPRRVVSISGRVEWAAIYGAFGKAVSIQAKGFDNPLRLQGQYADSATGLHFNRHRFFDPDTGTFVSPDPLGLNAGSDPYRFAPNVWNWIDPLGLTCLPPASGTLDWSGVDPHGLSRIDHVRLHGNDIPTKPHHGVFADDPIVTTNAAWQKAVDTGIVPTAQWSGNLAYDVPWPEAGLKGGVSGNAAGNPILNTVRIVTRPGGTEVVTAFPS